MWTIREVERLPTISLAGDLTASLLSLLRRRLEVERQVDGIGIADRRAGLCPEASSARRLPISTMRKRPSLGGLRRACRSPSWSGTMSSSWLLLRQCTVQGAVGRSCRSRHRLRRRRRDREARTSLTLARVVLQGRLGTCVRWTEESAEVVGAAVRVA